MASVSLIPLRCICRDGSTQIRAAMSKDTIADYSQLFEESASNPFPPIKVVQEGDLFYLFDGFHRVAAAERAGLTELEAEITPGTRRDAIRLACGANATHGLRRSNADKRRAVQIMVADEEWKMWSDREISRHCAVSAEFVGRVREKVSPSGTDSEVRTYTTRHGKQARMNTRNIGRKGKATKGQVAKNTAQKLSPEPPQKSSPHSCESPVDPGLSEAMVPSDAAAELGPQALEHARLTAEAEAEDSRAGGSPDTTVPKIDFDFDTHLEHGQQYLLNWLSKAPDQLRDSLKRELIGWMREV